MSNAQPARHPIPARTHRTREEQETSRLLRQDETDDDEAWIYQPQTRGTSVIQRGTMPGTIYRNGNSAAVVTPHRPRHGIAGPAQPRAQPHETEQVQAHQKTGSTRSGGSALLWIGLLMLACLAGYLALSAVGQWWQTTQDDWKYGRPRTFQIDYRVGHGDETTPSHFIAINLNRHVEIIECPASDCSKARIYLGPTLFGPGEALTPVTLSFVPGKSGPTMVVTIASARYDMINDHGSFRLPRPGEPGYSG
jgi:hypothetical protein